MSWWNDLRNFFRGGTAAPTEYKGYVPTSVVDPQKNPWTEPKAGDVAGQDTMGTADNKVDYVSTASTPPTHTPPPPPLASEEPPVVAAPQAPEPKLFKKPVSTPKTGPKKKASNTNVARKRASRTQDSTVSSGDDSSAIVAGIGLGLTAAETPASADNPSSYVAPETEEKSSLYGGGDFGGGGAGESYGSDSSSSDSSTSSDGGSSSSGSD